MTRRFTVVAFHAHPDDESLLTGGTLARASAEGHRVVLVVATLGDAGGSAARRRAELHTAAMHLGCARVVELGYGDCGLDGKVQKAAGPPRFVDVPVEEAASRLAEILREEQADVLTGYDARGGYGHPDHRQVHLVARYAVTLAGTPLLLEATLDRDLLRSGLRLMRWAGRFLPRLPLETVSTAYSAHSEITHVIDVRRYWRPKRTGLRAHASQTLGGDGLRTVALLGRLPRPLFILIGGREWFIAVPSRPAQPPETDIFASLQHPS